MGKYAVRVKPKNTSRHKLVGSRNLTRLWIHAISFKEIHRAEAHAQWLLDNNKEELLSAQVVTFGEGKVLRTIKKKVAASS